MANSRGETSAPKRAPARKRKPRRRWVRWLLGIGVPIAVAGALLLLILTTQITLTFDGRVWTLPARVYSSRLRIAPGMTIDRGALVERLSRCGYAKVDGIASRPGQFRPRPSGLEIYVRAFPGGDVPIVSRHVTVEFDGDAVSGIADDRKKPVAAIDLEPELLALVFGPRQEERQIVPLKEVPKDLVNAVLAAEDARFFHHAGIDPLAVVRAAFKNVSSGRVVQGGSTITQQTVKNLYLGQERTFWRKAREAVMSVILDLEYPKERILEVYLNEVYLGQRGPVAICGMASAARFYFGRSLQDLSLAESATLAGLIRNPGGYNPFL